jgi:hypothetical protein
MTKFREGRVKGFYLFFSYLIVIPTKIGNSLILSAPILFSLTVE